MDYLDQLNRQQLDAVQATEGPVRVLAGAGTGKTRALTARYCYLADLLGIDTSSILCLTFTNKAAAEMKNRIKPLLGDFDPAYICTFHSFCVRMLKEDIHVLNYPAQFVLIDEEEQADVLQKVYTDMGLTLKEMPIKRSVEYVGRRKESGDYLQYIEQLNNSRLEALCRSTEDRMEQIFFRYLYEQKKSFALDFDDVIIFAEHILTKWPDVLAKWQERMQYVMVDEFQDVSPRQYRIARLISQEHRNLFIVGDPDQTIYTWRGADVNLILDFDKLYPDAATIVLGDNYRSTPQILALCNSLISHNECRYPKQLTACSGPGVKPVMNHARSEKDEAVWIARRVNKLLKGGLAPDDIAVLYRAHHLSRPIEDALMKEGIPYVIYSGTAFYARREVKDVLAYLRMLVTADDIAFMRTVNNPSRRIGRQKLSVIRNIADSEDISLLEALRRVAGEPLFARTGAKAYLRTIDAGRDLLGKVPLGDLLQQMLDMSGYEEMLRNLSEWERLDNLAELKRAIEEAGHDDDATLDNFLSRAALIANIDRTAGENPTVKLMTVHTAKGMEFPVVFVCGLSEGNFPSRRSSGPEDIEEERRLAYVAVTRARRELYLSDSEGYSRDNTAKQPSRFIYEMGVDNMKLETPLPDPPKDAPVMAGAMEKARFALGDRVEHPVFGKGTVMGMDAAKQVFSVKFDNLNTLRTLRFGAPLESAD